MNIEFTISHEPSSWVSYHPTAELEGEIQISFKDGFVFKQTGVLVIELWKIITSWIIHPDEESYKYDSMDFDEAVFSFERDEDMYYFSSDNQELANITAISKDELLAGFKNFQELFYRFIKDKYNKDLNLIS